MTHLEQALNRRLRERGVQIQRESVIPLGYRLTDDGRDEFVHAVVQDVKDAEAEAEERRGKMKRA